MATEVIKTTFKLKRGTAERWAEVNPVLAQGEPGFVYDSNLLKIGDGVTPWNDLPYIQGRAEVANYETTEDFPAIGEPDIIYKASKAKGLYQFNLETGSYERLESETDIDDITIISGGTA